MTIRTVSVFLRTQAQQDDQITQQKQIHHAFGLLKCIDRTIIDESISSVQR